MSGADCVDEEREPAERIGGAYESEIDDHGQRKQRQPRVAAERFAVLKPDINDAGEHHREHEQDATEELQSLVQLEIVVAQHDLPVGLQHFVLFRSDA